MHPTEGHCGTVQEQKSINYFFSRARVERIGETETKSVGEREEHLSSFNYPSQMKFTWTQKNKENTSPIAMVEAAKGSAGPFYDFHTC